ncbi:MAG TPA: hypothetical protein VGH28_14620 [Polyangiaceae bacterium]|jgi:hypothetical protein
MKSRLPRNRALRALVVLVLVAAALETLYLAIANVALVIARKSLAAAAPVSVTFDHAFTLFPGFVSLRGVRVEQARAWTVTIASADVRFLPWQLVSEPRRIVSVTADVTDVSVESLGKTRRSSGHARLVARDVAIEASRVALDLDADVTNVTLENDGAVLARDVKGTMKLHVASVDFSGAAPLATTSGTIALDGVFVSLEPLASFGSLTTTQDPGTLHVAATLDGGLIGPASEILAHTECATLRDAHGANADFPHGLDVRMGVSKANAGALQLSVRAKTLAFGSADPKAAADAFEDFELVVPAGSTDLKRVAFVMRELDWAVRRATLHESTSVVTAGASGHLDLEVNHADELSSYAGRIALDHVVVDSPGETDHTPFEANVTLRRFTISRDRGIALRGDLHAHGDDPRPLLELVVTSPTVRGGLRALPARPFVLDTTLDRENGRLAFDDIKLDAAPLTIRGGYRRAGADARGAFLIEGGPLPLGVATHDGHETLALGATERWLSTQLEASP